MAPNLKTVSKRLLIAVVFIAVVGGAWVMAQMQGNGEGSSAGPIAAPKREIETKPWDGSAVRQYTATFIHGRQTIDLQRINYSGLHLPSATVDVTFLTPRTGGNVPAFVRPQTFNLVSPTGKVWMPQVSSQPAGPNTLVRLRFTKIPTARLGNQELVLFITKIPKGRFSLTLMPPRPPAGHSYAEAKPPTPKVSPAVSAQVKKGVQAWAKAWRTGNAATYCQTLSTQAVRALGGVSRCRANYRARLRGNAPGKVVVTKLTPNGKQVVATIEVTRKQKSTSRVAFVKQGSTYRYLRHLQ